MVSDSQEVTVDVDDIMSMRLTFKIETKRDNNREDEILEGMKYIENGYAEIIDRCYHKEIHPEPIVLHKYPMPEIGVDVYYNEKKQIAAINFVCTNSNNNKLHEELHTFLDKAGDDMAIKLYTTVAWYWCVLEAGFSLLSDMVDPQPEDETEGFSDSEIG